MRRTNGSWTQGDKRPSFSAAGNFQLDDDIDRGFESAVRNSQTVLAMQYLVLIKERLEAEIAELREQIKIPAEAKKTTAAKAKKED